MTLVAKVGATVLDGASGIEFLDQIDDAGWFRLTFKNGDPDIPAYGDVVTFEIDGTARFAGVVDADNIVSKATGEEVEELTTTTGPGRLGVTRKGLVRPVRGIGEQPTERTRSQFWGAWDFDDSSWPASKRIRRADAPTLYAPYRAIPEWNPARTAWWVWADQVDVDEEDAPVGGCLLRHAFTVDDDGPIRIFIGMNNRGIPYFDGARIGEITNAPKECQVIDIDVTAGTHVIAAQVTNFIRDGGYMDAIYTLDGDGCLDTLISQSDYTNTKCLPYPSSTPTISQGEAIRRVLEQMQDNGELVGVTLDFDDDEDSAGNPWDGVVEVSSTVGAKLYEYLLALADWAIDVQMAPGSNLLRAWNWGTRGSVTAVEVVGTTDRNTSEVEGLTHDGRDIRANRLLVGYRRGLLEVEDSASVLANGPVPDYVDFGDLETSEAATAAAQALMESRKAPSYATTLILAPVSSVPYEDFDVGDYIEHPDETGGTKVSRVRSISVKKEDASLTYVLELNEIRREWRARQDNTLKRYAMGSLAGGSRMVSKSGDPLPSLARVTEKSVAEFSFQDPVAGAITARDPAKSSGNLIEFYAEVTTEDGDPSTSDSQVRVYLNTTSLGTLTIPAGDDAADFDLGAQKVNRNADRLRAEVVTVGGGVNGITVQVRAI